tara:strand:- start:149 stop:691 length:543 start_codon:yes stop_codon:yes gene_type:complete
MMSSSNLESGTEGNVGRVSISGRIIDLLWTDDEFYREVSSLKKISSSNKFPRTDQWCDDQGFHMAFALAGYSFGDIEIFARGHELSIIGSGGGSSIIDEKRSHSELPAAEEDYLPRNKNKQIHHGVISRGIARRNFRAKYYINPEFDLARATAKMNNGLLEVTIPRVSSNDSVMINIKDN